MVRLGWGELDWPWTELATVWAEVYWLDMVITYRHRNLQDMTADTILLGTG